MLTQIGALLISTFFGLYVLVLILRFLLQAVRADFYNPISQFVIKATNPVVMPLKMVIPTMAGFDLSVLIVAYAMQWLKLFLLAMIGAGFLNFGFLFFQAALGLVTAFIDFYFWGLLLVVLLSWVAPGSYSPPAMLINQVISPVLNPIRKYMPDTGGIDFSPIILLLLLHIARILIDYLGASWGGPRLMLSGLGGF